MSIIGWKQIYTHTVTGAAETSITIPDLHGDVDIEYKLEARIVNGYNGAVSYYIKPNNDTGANYGYQDLSGNNTTAAASRTTTGIRITYISALNNLGMTNATIQAKSGYVRTAIIENILDLTGTTVNYVTLYGSSWNNTADEITSLVVLADQTGGLGIGTVITLSARATLTEGMTISSSTTKTQGTYALKAVAPITTSLNQTLTKTFASSLDLTGVNTLKLDMRASRTGANIKLGLHDTGGTTTELTPTISTADAYQTITWDLSAVTDANKNAIDTFVITVVNADAKNTMYFDNFYIYSGTLLEWVTP
jgi:hypothetical protein